MQTLLLVRVIFGLLIQRSLARLLDDRCGTAINMRISHGGNAEPEAAAWMAGVGNETQFLCGGTLIHKRFVLTAAHCIEGHGRLFVKLGAYNLSLPAVEYRVSHAEFHRGYSSDTFQHDIGLLKLPLDVVYTAQIFPICIKLHPTTQTVSQVASIFYAYGWGRTHAAYHSEILQRVTLHRYHRSRCNKMHYSPVTSNQICAGSSNSDTCYGDSGGPLTNELSYNGIRRLTQQGIISYGFGSCEGLGVYTDVTRYADWIEEKIKAPSPQYSWPPSSSAAGISNPGSISAPSKTVAFGAESFDGARLLVEPCGTAVSTRIVNGKDAKREAAAWMASVHDGTNVICGSTVIHRRFVLTSANCASLHCDLFVCLGAYHGVPTMKFNVTKKIRHDKFDWKYNDIGLLQLSGDIPFSRRIYPICIILNPEFKRKVENTYTFDAYGWGYKKDRILGNLLQVVTVYRYNHSCEQFEVNFPVISSQICAGSSVGGTCQGDAGGPLTKKILVNGLQRQTQIGVIGIHATLSCQSGLYTDVTSYVDWIVRKVRGFTAG